MISLCLVSLHVVTSVLSSSSDPDPRYRGVTFSRFRAKSPKSMPRSALADMFLLIPYFIVSEISGTEDFGNVMLMHQSLYWFVIAGGKAKALMTQAFTHFFWSEKLVLFLVFGGNCVRPVAHTNAAPQSKNCISLPK